MEPIPRIEGWIPAVTPVTPSSTVRLTDRERRRREEREAARRARRRQDEAPEDDERPRIDVTA